ncbi:PilZ domain-containing protein [uncultured Methylobacterium sp.]|jgi:hypothetical protein|uniref:PilZ domain-containing protein n=1 Tax=uncultured Methylobacterium sp. TaxID=157278 RepID=UPI00263554E1|nr:PilZ domain-containing protein [uncultured Methylobacterium sp.]
MVRTSTTQIDPPRDAQAPRAPLRINGRCLFADGEEHACQTREIGLDEAVLSAPVSGRPGEPVTLYLDNVGALTGTIVATAPDGFRLRIEVNAERRVRIAARLDWVAARGEGGVEQRSDVRIVPTVTDVRVRLPDGTHVAGSIVDMSMTGIALAIPVQPPVGSQVTVGKRFATVVRHLDGGFAAAFKLPFRPETFSQHATP